MTTSSPCPICGSDTRPVGALRGRYHPEVFQVRTCPNCRFSHVANPWRDYAQIYNEDYYRGRGPDPLLDYVFELEHPEETVRIYEWEGILRIVHSLTAISTQTRWLDYGCGNGGLVRHIRQVSPCFAVGYEEGWIAERAARCGIPLVSAAEFDQLAGSFDIVSLIEVIEHIPDPVSCLRQASRLLRPGGLVYLTTGNARPYRQSLLKWSYLAPEIHVSLFEPESLALAMQKAGLRPEYVGPRPGLSQVIRFEILKNLRVSRRNRCERLLPWPLLASLADKRFEISAQPVGWKPEAESEAKTP
jgi:2-polyprenyl-3-methyl-5-hydroxy-6-metoxy-1,4-benzoquinol methylase